MLIRWNIGCHLPGGRIPEITESGMNVAVDLHVLRPGAAHAGRDPIGQHRDFQGLSAAARNASTIGSAAGS